MPAKAYATTQDLEEFREEVNAEFRDVHKAIKANSLNGLKPDLEAIVRRERQRAEVRVAFRTLAHWLRLNGLAKVSEKIWFAFLGGIGFLIAAKIIDQLGLLSVVAHAIHAAGGH